MAQPAVPTPAVDRRNLDQWLTEVERAGAAQPRPERRGLDALRAEVQRTLVTADGDVISNTGSVWRALLKPSRLALIAVALVAGGAAAWFATQGAEPPAPPVELAQPVAEPPPPPAAPLNQILVAKQAVALGARLTPELVEWKAWPTDALRTDYITEAAKPQAVEEMAGAIARYEFFPGEPIRLQKLAVPGDGYLSAVLQPGEVGVSVPVTPDTGAGGFIQPNDHVDVLLNQSIDGAQVTDTVLRNVRVLAIAHRLGDVGNQAYWDEEPVRDPAEGTAPSAFGENVVATLALDPRSAELVTSARSTGTLTLVLRSIADFAAAPPADPATLNANQRIRLTSPFWTGAGTAGAGAPGVR